MNTIYIAIAIVSAALWIPIWVQFYRSWLSRKNPVSLAICILISFTMWSALTGIWAALGWIQLDIMMIVTAAMSAVVAINAHIAFYWSRKRFVDARLSIVKSASDQVG